MEKTDIPKLFIIKYEGLYKSLLFQFYMQPFILLLVSITVFSTYQKFTFDPFFIAIAMIFFWAFQGWAFSHIKPFYLIASTSKNKENTKVISGYRTKKIVGNLMDFSVLEDEAVITVENKKGEERELNIPLSELSKETFLELKNAVTNIKTTDFTGVLECFAKHGLKTKHVNESYAVAAHAGSLSKLFFIRTVMILPVMVFYFYLIFKLSIPL